VPIAIEQVAEARESLLRIADQLRGPEPVAARGVAMVERLLTDAGSVLYTESARGAVELQVRAALDRLGGSATEATAAISASATPAGRPRLTQTA
jgi:hypothetical protein